MKKIIINTTLVIICAVAIITAVASNQSKEAASNGYVEAEKEPRHLNDTLTNAMSEIDSLAGLDRDIKAYLDKWEIKGASLAIMRNDSLVYAKGYGWADMEKGDSMTPRNIMRMASVSKLITATGIMQLQEQGKLSLSDKVFGPEGILCDSVYTAAIKDKRMFRITVEQLLRHKGGFSCGRGDPMFSTTDIIRQFRLDGAPDSETLLRCILTRPLGFSPGTTQLYSNFGYLLLSLVIERVSGTDYESFIKDNVLKPAGCYDFHIAGNFYKDKRPNEVRYYMQAGADSCETFNLNGEKTIRCYGGSNITALQGAGAWCGSPSELCRFVASIDGKPEVPDIISLESVKAMTEYFDPNTFSLGWNDTKPDGEWTRTGTLAGSTALIKCYPDGECWIMLTNTGTYRGPHFSKYTSSLFKRCRAAYSKKLPARNMFVPE